MIYYSIPWNSTKNIGLYYNAFMRLLPSKNDYACFVDGDACFTTNHFGKQLEDIIKKYPECGLFTAMTNRLACKWQRVGNWVSNDMADHRRIGEMLLNDHYDQVKDVTDRGVKEPLGGVLILIKQSTWHNMGGFRENGMLGVDNDIHYRAIKAKEKVYLMKGVYMQHWYRGGNIKDKAHLV